MAIGTEIYLDRLITDEEAEATIRQQIAENPLLLYMKGNPMMPQCGFSARVVQILNQVGVAYSTFDVLKSPPIREGIKRYSDWPTIPQLYHNQEFLGGCDIITELYQEQELAKIIAE